MIPTPSRDFECVLLDSVTSTMDVAKKLNEHIGAHSTLFTVVARKQWRGRGRGGSSWDQAGVSAPQGNEQPVTTPLDEAKSYTSLAEALHFEHDFLPLTVVVPAERIKIPFEWVSIATGCALVDAIFSFRSFFETLFSDFKFPTRREEVIRLKWPNDVVCLDELEGPKKIAGVLCESQLSGSKFQNFFIGIGLNFFDDPQLEHSTSLIKALLSDDSSQKTALRKMQKQIERNELRSVLLKRFAQCFENELAEYLCVPRLASQLQALAISRSVPLGTLLSVNKGTQFGPFAGLSENGGLLLSNFSEPIVAGDVGFAPTSKRGEAKAANREKVKDSTKVEDKQEKTFVLSLDLGNTRLHWALCEGGGALLQNGDIAYKQMSDEKELLASLRPLLVTLKDACATEVLVPLISVCSRAQKETALEVVERFFTRMLPSLRLYKTELTSRDLMQFSNLKYDAKELGADRALRFLYAAETSASLGAAVAVLSFGTATTVEVVGSDGAILQSAILAGLQMELDALSEKTAKLPHITVEEQALPPPDVWSTKDSLQKGAELTAVGIVTSVALAHRPGLVVLSGGNATAVHNYLHGQKLDALKSIQLKVERTLETTTLASIGYRLMEAKKHQATTSERRSFTPRLATRAPGADFAVRAQDEASAPNPSTSIDKKLSSPEVAPWLLKTMLKARFQRQMAGRKAPTPEEFRRIGGRLENVDIGMRFDRYLAKHYPFLTRNLWRERIFSGEVMVEHNSPKLASERSAARFTRVKHTYRLQPFDQIWLFHPPELEPESVNECEVIYDNGDVVAFSKPGNLVVHATGMYVRNTFISQAHKMGYSDCAPVHRIDRETSGLLLCARKTSTRSRLGVAFKESQMQKMYLAICKGSREVPRYFRIDEPIGEAVHSRIRLKLWVGTPGALYATTDVAKLATLGEHSLFACMPRTGRTNQIRIHLMACGYWIVGDKMYHPNEDVFIDFYENGLTSWALEQLAFPRHLLHNAGIALPTEFGATDPIVCPVTKDLLEYAPASELLRAAGISLEAKQQSEDLSKLFAELAAYDFENAERVTPMMQ